MTEQNKGDARVRVGLVILELSRGGAEKALFELATRLDRSRFEVVVYTISGRARDLEESYLPELETHGIETRNLGLRSVWGASFALGRLAKAFQRDHIDVAQTFMYHANILGRVAGRLGGVRLICAGIRVAERDGRFRLLVDRWTRFLCDAWICVGESTARFTRETGRIPRSRVYSIPNGVSLDGLECRAAREGGRKLMIAIGRLCPQKGFDWLLATHKRWLTPSTRRDWELWIVGAGEDREALERLCEEEGLGDFARFVGWRKDVRELLCESDLFLLPSRWEGMANALLEACAAGLPTLCMEVEGTREVLGESCDEQICAPGNAEEWGRKLERLTDDADLRARLGARNRDRVAREFTLDGVARRYEDLWTRLLSERTRSNS
ncbi:MAG: glycosyltransferase [Thermoguttaceae bacterium]